MEVNGGNASICFLCHSKNMDILNAEIKLLIIILTLPDTFQPTKPIIYLLRSSLTKKIKNKRWLIFSAKRYQDPFLYPLHFTFRGPFGLRASLMILAALLKKWWLSVRKELEKSSLCLNPVSVCFGQWECQRFITICYTKQ